MKKRLFLILTLILAIIQMQAQEQSETQVSEYENRTEIRHNRENCKDVSLLKKQYIKDSLQLAPEEENDFWAIYDQTEQEEQEVHEAFLKFKNEQLVVLENGRVDHNALTEAQKLLLLEKRIERKTKLALIEQDFFNKIQKVIQPKAVLQYYKLEKEFRKKVISESKKREHSLMKDAEAEPIPKKIRR